MSRTVVSALLLLAVALVASHELKATKSPTIKFLNGEIDPNEVGKLDEGLLGTSADERKELFLVQFAFPFNTENVKKVQKFVSGTVFGYAPDNAVFLYTTPSDAHHLSVEGGHYGVVWVGRVPHAHKKHPALKSLSEEAEASGLLGSNGEMVHLRAMTVPGLSIEDLAALAKVWEGNKGHAPSLTAVSSRVIMATVAPNAAQAAADALAAEPEIMVVERRHATHLNNRYAHGVMQSNDEGSSPLHEAGLSGKNQLVGVGDSGVDFHRCSFFDDNEPTIVKSPDVNVEDNNHRKIKAYWSLQDAIDSDSGHGTHVCGTVAGNAHKEKSPEYETLSKYNGAAYDARLLFTDIGCQTEGGCVCDDDRFCTARCPKKTVDGKLVRVCEDSARETWEPDDLTQLFPWTKKNGGYIHTNSWGEGTGHDVFGYYKVATASIDQFAWDNKDFLILFAAGNSGSEGFYSIDPEGSAKNCITVGASQTTNSGFADVQEHFTNYETLLNNARGWCEREAKVDCTPLESQDSICAVAKADRPAPVCDLMKAAGLQPCENLCKETAVAKIRADTVHFGQENLAYFTSLGLTRDGRVKPDVTAPGYNIISTNGSDPKKPTKCGDNDKAVTELTPKSGTSMATPNTAAHATLVRQYFTDGFFPGGRASQAGFKPSSALIKGVLINSGKELHGVIQVGAGFHGVSDDKGSVPAQYVPPFMSPNHGWGRVTLNATLPLANSDSCVRMVLATDGGADGSVDNTGDTFKRCFVAKAGLPLKVTLVYTDYPSVPNAAINLVNDLDLKVTADRSGKTVLGNHLVGVNDDGSFAPVPDRRNNVEQVYVKSPDSDLYCATVTAHRIVHGPQPFALVITGCDAKGVAPESIY